MVIKVASKVFCACLYIPGQSNYGVIIAGHENIWSGMMNEGPTKFYKSQTKKELSYYLLKLLLNLVSSKRNKSF